MSEYPLKLWCREQARRIEEDSSGVERYRERIVAARRDGQYAQWVVNGKRAERYRFPQPGWVMETRR